MRRRRSTEKDEVRTSMRETNQEGRRRRKRSRRAHRECRQQRQWDGRRRIRNTLFKRNGRGTPLAAVFFIANISPKCESKKIQNLNIR
jgi:hypothetical protein